MSLFWVVLVTLASVLAGGSLCLYLLYHARDFHLPVWLLEHAICPVLRIIVLLVVVSQVYPVIDESFGPLDFWRVLIATDHFDDLVNILFFGSLLLAFIPLLDHPVVALPLQSGLAIALVFHWQYGDTLTDLTLLPSLTLVLKIVIYMLIAYLVTRELAAVIARAVDEHWSIDGSIRLVSDALFVALQLPVMYTYAGYLQAQLGT